MTAIFRSVFLLVYALFWGGLTLYTGIVVRISHDLLGDPIDGGLITQRVTVFLQYLCAMTVVLMVCNTAIVFRKLPQLGRLLLGCTTVLAAALIGLFVVHGHLDAVIDVAAYEITDRDAFTTGHRRYNQLTTVQWLATLAYLPLTIIAWKRIDASKVSEDE
ncbi:MAG: hypothetical protein AAFV88_09070 [Planctomycetota bacterium]